MTREEHKPIPNTFGLPAKADVWMEYDTEAELLALIADKQIATPFIHVGAGSNLLFAGDYHGTVLHSGIRGMEVVDRKADAVLLRVGAGTTWDDVVAHCVEQGYYGTENLSLIPGEMGSAAVQNIGAYGVEVKDLIEKVETIDLSGHRRTFSVHECAYAYRDSLFKRPDMKSTFITYVTLRLSLREAYHTDYGSIRRELESQPAVTLEAVRQVIIGIRRSKLPDPEVVGNAGSFFKNPVIPAAQFASLLSAYPDLPHYDAGPGLVKLPAGWLIERCGWKGRSLGRAAVHDRQALVLANNGGATADEVLALSDAIRADVFRHFGVSISPEVNIIANQAFCEGDTPPSFSQP